MSRHRRMENMFSSSVMPLYQVWDRTMGKARTGRPAVLQDSSPKSSPLRSSPIVHMSKKPLPYSKGCFAGRINCLVGSWLSSLITGLWSSSIPTDPCDFGRLDGMSTSRGSVTPSSMSKDSRMWSQMRYLGCMLVGMMTFLLTIGSMWTSGWTQKANLFHWIAYWSLVRCSYGHGLKSQLAQYPGTRSSLEPWRVVAYELSRKGSSEISPSALRERPIRGSCLPLRKGHRLRGARYNRYAG